MLLKSSHCSLPGPNGKTCPVGMSCSPCVQGTHVPWCCFPPWQLLALLHNGHNCGVVRAAMVTLGLGCAEVEPGGYVASCWVWACCLVLVVWTSCGGTSGMGGVPASCSTAARSIGNAGRERLSISHSQMMVSSSFCVTVVRVFHGLLAASLFQA